jgi:ABC-type lipoprotein export system ATPase subunit
MLGIVGASGSGKSTLLNILGGLDRPSAGRVTVDGRDLLKLSDGMIDRYRRLEVGFVWQQTTRNLITYLSARENVEVPMTVAGAGLLEKRRRSRQLLESVGLWEHRRHRLAQLSGGQQQRVAIAVALANRPKLLLADEPTGEVDSATAQELLDLLGQMNRDLGLTTIIVTHDPQIARRVDRVVAIRDGKTSMETIRRVSQLEEAMVGSHGDGPADLAASEAHFEEYVVLDSAGRLQVPREYLETLGIGDRVTLEMADGGILIRPAASDAPEPGKPETKDGEATPPSRRRGVWDRLSGLGKRRERGT